VSTLGVSAAGGASVLFSVHSVCSVDSIPGFRVIEAEEWMPGFSGEDRGHPQGVRFRTRTVSVPILPRHSPAFISGFSLNPATESPRKARNGTEEEDWEKRRIHHLGERSDECVRFVFRAFRVFRGLHSRF